MNRCILSRDVTIEECGWLDKDMKKGEVVFFYSGYTYGCINEGTAVTKEDGVLPFFELPDDALNI